MTRVRTPLAGRPAMIDLQIRALEIRLQRGRSLSRHRAGAVLTDLRRRLTSPLTLLIAASAGVAMHRLGLVHHARSAASHPTRPNAPHSLLVDLVRTFSLVASMVAMIPPAPARIRPPSEPEEPA